MEQIEETKDSTIMQEEHKQLFAKIDVFLKGYNRQSIKFATLQKKFTLEPEHLQKWLQNIGKQSHLSGSGKNLTLNNFYKNTKETSISSSVDNNQIISQTISKQNTKNTSAKLSETKNSHKQHNTTSDSLIKHNQNSSIRDLKERKSSEDIQVQLSNITSELDAVLQQELSQASHHPLQFIIDLEERACETVTGDSDSLIIENAKSVTPQQLIGSKPIIQPVIEQLIDEICDSQQNNNIDHSTNNDDKQQQLSLQLIYKELLFNNDNNSDWKNKFKQDVEFCIVKSSQGLYHQQISFFLNDPELNGQKFNNILFQIIYICLQLLIQQKTEKEHRDSVFHINLRKLMTGITTEQKQDNIINSVIDILKTTTKQQIN